MDTVLMLLKSNLQLSVENANAGRDSYLTALANSAKAEISARGITLDTSNTEDCILIADYAAWLYRARAGNAGMPEHLRIRLNNRQFREKMRATDV